VASADSDSVSVAPDSADTTSTPLRPVDSAGVAQPPPGTSQPPGNPPRAPIPRPAPPRIPTDTAPAPAEPPRAGGWIVSFAAYLSEPSARARAADITVDGQKARVVSGLTPGTTTTVYRVILGPYPTKADAERVGRESRESFWVYQGNP